MNFRVQLHDGRVLERVDSYTDMWRHVCSRCEGFRPCRCEDYDPHVAQHGSTVFLLDGEKISALEAHALLMLISAYGG